MINMFRAIGRLIARLCRLRNNLRKLYKDISEPFFLTSKLSVVNPSHQV
jgi:hypothetical protein